VILGRVLVRGTNRPSEPAESILDGEASVLRTPFILVGYLLMATGSIGLPFVRLIKSAICREREWLADATAVQFTRDPEGIVGALKRIGGLLKKGRLDTPYAETASHLYFANSSFARGSASSRPTRRWRSAFGRLTRLSMANSPRSSRYRPRLRSGSGVTSRPSRMSWQSKRHSRT